MKKLFLTLFLAFNLISCTASKCSINDLAGQCLHIHNQTILPLSSFVKIDTYIKINGDKPRQFSTASGFLVSEKRILTARHVCDTDMFLSMLGKPPPGTKVTVFWGLTSYKGELYLGSILRMHPTADLCLMELDTPAKDMEIVKISPVPPKIGEKVYNFAAPLGYTSRGMLPIFEGFFSGTTISSLTKTPAYIFTIPTKPGSSGSAIVNEHGELVGVVSGGMRQMENISISSTHQQIADFLLD